MPMQELEAWLGCTRHRNALGFDLSDADPWKILIYQQLTARVRVANIVLPLGYFSRRARDIRAPMPDGTLIADKKAKHAMTIVKITCWSFERALNSRI